MEISIKENTCVLKVEAETYEGRIEGNNIVIYDFAVGGCLMNFLGSNPGHWQIGETVYTKAIMEPCVIMEGRMIAPKLVFSN